MTTQRQAATAPILPAPMTRATFAKLHTGERLTDEELVGAALHFDALEQLLTPLLPFYTLAWDGAVKEANRVRDIVSARGLKAAVAAAKVATS